MGNSFLVLFLHFLNPIWAPDTILASELLHVLDSKLDNMERCVMGLSWLLWRWGIHI